MDIKILENLLQVTIHRGNLRTRHHLVIQKEVLWSIFGLLQEWKSGAAEHDRSGKPETTSWDILQKVAPHREESLLDGNAHSVRYGETIHDGSGKPEKLNHQEEANSENFVMGSDAAEFVNKVKDQVRNRQKRMLNVAESGEEHSMMWRMFMAATMNAATFKGKNFSTIQSVVKNHEDLTLKQMFDVTAQLGINQDEINGLDKIQWEKYSWTRLSLIGDETVINLQRTKVYVFSRFCVVPRKGSSTSRFQRSLEEQSCRSPIREKLQRL